MYELFISHAFNLIINDLNPCETPGGTVWSSELVNWPHLIDLTLLTPKSRSELIRIFGFCSWTIKCQVELQVIKSVKNVKTTLVVVLIYFNCPCLNCSTEQLQVVKVMSITLQWLEVWSFYLRCVLVTVPARACAVVRTVASGLLVMSVTRRQTASGRVCVPAFHHSALSQWPRKTWLSAARAHASA